MASFRANLFSDGETCAICLDPLETGAVTILHPCRHCLHLNCLLAGRLAKCPLCNAALTVSNAAATATGGQQSMGDGYAVIDSEGTKYWRDARGQLHRENDLPAIEWADGDKEWYRDDVRHRDNGLPAIERADGTKQWWVNGKRHRENGLPAVEWANGDKWWFVDGKAHRENGLPAIERADGTKLWFIHDQFVRSESI